MHQWKDPSDDVSVCCLITTIALFNRWRSRVRINRCWLQPARCSWASRRERSLISPWRRWRDTSGPSSPTWLLKWGFFFQYCRTGKCPCQCFVCVFLPVQIWTCETSHSRLHLLQEIYKDRKKFSEQVFKVASSDLVNMGISVVSYTLKDVHDDQVISLRWLFFNLFLICMKFI